MAADKRPALPKKSRAPRAVNDASLDALTRDAQAALAIVDGVRADDGTDDAWLMAGRAAKKKRARRQ